MHQLISLLLSSFCLPPPLVCYPYPRFQNTPSISSSQSEHSMDSLGCVPHCLHHRAARGLSGSSICLLCVSASPSLSLLASHSVCSALPFCTHNFTSPKFFGFQMILILHKKTCSLGSRLVETMAAAVKEWSWPGNILSIFYCLAKSSSYLCSRELQHTAMLLTFCKP